MIKILVTQVPIALTSSAQVSELQQGETPQWKNVVKGSIYAEKGKCLLGFK